MGELKAKWSIASHDLFEVHCPAQSCRLRQITCVWWTKAVIICCYFKNRVILSQNYSVFKITTINNSVLFIVRKLSGEICTFKQDSALQTGHVKQSNHFACNFAKSVPILKILSPANRTTIIL